GLQRKMRHADYGVHRSANFMAHVSQKFGFDLGGAFGEFLCAAQLLLIGLQSAIGGFKFLLTRNDLSFGGGEGFSLCTSLFKEALGFEVSGEKLGVHGHRGEKRVQEGLLAVGEDRDGSEFDDANQKVLIEYGHKKKLAGDYRTHACRHANGISLS